MNSSVPARGSIGRFVAMSRQGRQQSIKVFWPNVGSIVDYPRATNAILAFIGRSKPARSDAIVWIRQTYAVVHEFARKLLNVLHACGVLHREGSRYELAPPAMEYLSAGDPLVLFRLFSQRVLGFAEMVQVLEAEGPLTLKDLERKWARKMKPLVFAKNQAPIRYNWLRGFGLASVVAHEILLTEKGLKLAAELRLRSVPTQQERTRVSHLDLENKMKIIGEFFEFEAKTRPSLNEALPSYALKLREGDRQLDCLWVRYIPFAGIVRFPVEVQLGGNLADSLESPRDSFAVCPEGCLGND